MSHSNTYLSTITMEVFHRQFACGKDALNLRVVSEMHVATDKEFLLMSRAHLDEITAYNSRATNIPKRL